MDAETILAQRPAAPNQNPHELAYKGFSHLARVAKQLRDKLSEAGAPQAYMTRVNGVIFSAEVGEKNAADAFVCERGAKQ